MESREFCDSSVGVLECAGVYIEQSGKSENETQASGRWSEWIKLTFTEMGTLKSKVIWVRSQESSSGPMWDNRARPAHGQTVAQ